MPQRMETLRCPVCRRRTQHQEAIGPRTRDPVHIDDRSRDFHEVKYCCLECGRTERRRRYPDLLSGFFHR